MASSRRQFIGHAAGAIAGSMLGPLGLVTSGCSDINPNLSEVNANGTAGRKPNILLVLVDQFRLPPDGYGANEGEAAGMREIFRFENTLPANNAFSRFFPAFLRLRKNAVVLRQHYIASAACAPSRSTFITGQYPSLHGVTQVDGLFKAASEIKFLDPQGVPTIGDWFQAAGYDSYYFGKWHCSDEESAPYDLTPWGFAGWETSGPEPHGSNPDNLGAYRDPQFTTIVSDFFHQRGSQKTGKPWFAVASLVNPHDIAAYPFPFYLPGTGGVTQPQIPLNLPQPIPAQGTVSNQDSKGNTTSLNPDGFPQNNFSLPGTYNEDLSTKPSCHLEAAWKVQLGLLSIFPNIAKLISPYPFQSQALDQAWSISYCQFYAYLQYLVDIELTKVLNSFDAAGLAENTIIVFSSDHGEHAMAHGQMLQKWHTAYEESVRVPFVVSSPLVNASADTLKEVVTPTSHIDLAPTLLGLAGFHADQVGAIKSKIAGHTQVRDFVGTDLSPLITGSGSIPRRGGVLFTTEDEVTQLPAGVAAPSKQTQFDQFVNNVNLQILAGAPLSRGPVIQPNCVRMLRSGDFKLNRYFDPAKAAADQWEFYHLASDGRETVNLVDFRTGTLRNVPVPGFTAAQLQDILTAMKAELSLQEKNLLLTPV